MQHALKLLALLPLACAAIAAAAPDTPAKPAPPTKPTPTPAPPTKPAPAPAPEPHVDACRPAGSVLFEIDHRVDPGAKLSTSTTKVFANGAWTHDEADGEGKALAPRTGCFAKLDVKQLDAALHGAPWKITTARIRCMARSAQFTVYLVDGKPVFTQRLCSGETLDDKSRAALDAAVAQVEGQAGKATP